MELFTLLFCNYGRRESASQMSDFSSSVSTNVFLLPKPSSYSAETTLHHRPWHFGDFFRFSEQSSLDFFFLNNSIYLIVFYLIMIETWLDELPYWSLTYFRSELNIYL